MPTPATTSAAADTSRILKTLQTLSREVAALRRTVSAMRPEPDRLIGAVEAAHLLGVSRATISEMCRNGQLACIKDGPATTPRRFSYNYIQQYIRTIFPVTPQS